MEFEMNKYLYLVLITAIIISSFFFGSIINTYIVVKNNMKFKIEWEYNNNKDIDRNRMISLYSSNIDAKGLLTFILTVLFPSVIAVIQFTGILSWL